MKPGRELDALIAEKVMGFKGLRFQTINPSFPPDLLGSKLDYFGGAEVHIMNYSTDIAAAFEVIGALQLRQFDLRMGFTFTSIVWMDFQNGKEVRAEGETPMHAICLAALKAMDL